MKNIRIFICKLTVFGGEIFNIFERACFRDGYLSSGYMYIVFALREIPILKDLNTVEA